MTSIPKPIPGSKRKLASDDSTSAKKQSKLGQPDSSQPPITIHLTKVNPPAPEPDDPEMDELKQLMIGVSQGQNDMKAEMKDAIQKVQQTVDGINQTLANFETRLVATEEATQLNTTEIGKLKSELEELKKLVLTGTNQSNIQKIGAYAMQIDAVERRNNLIISGVKENQGETKPELVGKIVQMYNDLNIIPHPTGVLHSRMGKLIPGKNRLVKLQFETRFQRERVWNSRYGLRDLRQYDGVYIGDDVPEEIQKKRFEERQERRAQAAAAALNPNNP